MDRTLTYPGSLPQDTDILSPQRNTMVAIGMALRAILGTSAVADGLACVPTGPASMQVVVGAGSLTVNGVVDSGAYGSLAANTTDALVKMGINTASTTMSALTAPATPGQSQNFLIQAAVSETDAGSTVLPYYNASNPSAPYSGPANAGTAQNTRRAQTVTLSWKAGSAATTGSQTTPTPDAGYVGLWVVTVANGATTVIAGNITEYALAPFLRSKLPEMRRRLTANLSLYVASTGNDANSGLSAAAPLLTLNAAWSKIVSGFDLAGYTVTVSVADGTYAPLSCAGVVTGSLGEGYVSFVGNTTTPANCIIAATSASAITGLGGAQLSVNGFKVTATGTSAGQGCGIYAASPGTRIKFGANMDFGACAVAHQTALSGGQVVATSNYTVSGSAPALWFAAANGVISQLAAGTVTLTGTPAFSTAAALAQTGGVLSLGGITLSGSATGARYLAAANGVIDTNGGGASYLPGNSAGSTATGGQYV